MQFCFGFGSNTPFHIRFRPQIYDSRPKLEWVKLMEDIRHWMGLHTLHRKKNFELKPYCYWDEFRDTSITLYMLNTVIETCMGRCVGQMLPECWAAGDRHQNYACPDALTASPASPSFPHSPPDLSAAGPVVPRDTGGITVQWPSVTGRSLNWSVSFGSLQVICSHTWTTWQLETCRQSRFGVFFY